MTNSLEKGKRGERLFCAAIEPHGLNARRCRQSDGKLDPDVVIEGLEHIHCEIKFDGGVSLGTKAWEQACQQAESDAKARGLSHWIMAFKRSRLDWCMTWPGENGHLLTVSGSPTMSAVLLSMFDTIPKPS